MRRACKRGCRTYDYGRSKRGTGSFDFKTNWGFEPQPLHYEYQLLKREAVPQNNPSNPGTKRLSGCGVGCRGVSSMHLGHLLFAPGIDEEVLNALEHAAEYGITVSRCDRGRILVTLLFAVITILVLTVLWPTTRSMIRLGKNLLPMAIVTS